MERRVGFGDFGESLRAMGALVVDWMTRGLLVISDVSDVCGAVMGKQSLRGLETRRPESSGRDFSR